MTSNLSPAQARELRLEIEEFNTEYARTLDDGDVEGWADYFVEDGFYRVTARENADAGLPVGLVWCEGKAMLRDRAAAILKTMVYAPRYTRHLITNVRVSGLESDGGIAAEANYLILETLMEDETRIFQTGQYRDVFVRSDEGLRLKSRDCVYDSHLIPNDMVYPA